MTEQDVLERLRSALSANFEQVTIAEAQAAINGSAFVHIADGDKFWVVEFTDTFLDADTDPVRSSRCNPRMGLGGRAATFADSDANPRYHGALAARVCGLTRYPHPNFSLARTM